MKRAEKKAQEAARKFWSPAIGATYLVRGYHTGEFVGEVQSCDRDIATVTVVDAPQRMAKIKDRCPFPGCVLPDLHEGKHDLANFSALFIGQRLEIPWKLAQFEPQIQANNIVEFRAPKGAA